MHIHLAYARAAKDYDDVVNVFSRDRDCQRCNALAIHMTDNFYEVVRLMGRRWWYS